MHAVPPQRGHNQTKKSHSPCAYAIFFVPLRPNFATSKTFRTFRTFKQLNIYDYDN